MVEAVTNIEMPAVDMGSAGIVSSGERSGKSPMSTKKRKSKTSKKDKRKANKLGISAVASQTAKIMGEDEVEEHAEAMDLIQSPHKVQISILCRNLVDMDGIGKSDPFAILYVKGEKDQKWQRVGRTKTIPNELNPVFEEHFFVNYLFERNQIVKVEVFDEDDDGPDELIGNFECFLNKILTAHNQTIKGELTMGQQRIKSKERGKIYLTANSVSKSNNVAKMDIVCRILDKKKKDKKGFLCFCKPPEDNPFLIIERQGPVDGNKTTWIKVLETEVMEDSLEAKFKKISVNMFRLCNGDRALPLRFSLYSKSGFSKPLLYGHAEICAKDIKPEMERELINERAKPKLAGTIQFMEFDVIEQPSFVDYLKAGWYINMTVAIDFTASNGALHDLDPLMQKKNDYELAILEVGRILQPYSYKQQFTAFGFGGIPNFILDRGVDRDTVNMHCFTLSEKSMINSLDGLLTHYREAIAGTTLWGPTLFSPLFSEMEAYMQGMDIYQMYHCLLILTDGVIHDLRETVDKIVLCTTYPLSIIIVGIGDADFTAMETLDSDEFDLVDGNGETARRDICQFVRLNEFREVQEDGTVRTHVDKLAEAVLAEVPDQLVGYMQERGLKPGQKPKDLVPIDSDDNDDDNGQNDQSGDNL